LSSAMAFTDRASAQADASKDGICFIVNHSGFNRFPFATGAAGRKINLNNKGIRLQPVTSCSCGASPFHAIGRPVSIEYSDFKNKNIKSLKIAEINARF
jgi:hypothetical protein